MMARNRLTLFVLICVLVISGCVPSGTTETPPSTAAIPTAVQTPLSTSSAVAIPSAISAPGNTVTPAATPTGAWIRVTPAKAAPGAQVTIEGFLPGGPDQASSADDQVALHANLCWQGCLTGLVYEGMPVTWSADQAGHFSIPFSVPSVPWLASSTVNEVAAPHDVATGDYSIGIQCLGGEKTLTGCAQQEALATTSIHVEGPGAQSCPNPACATLTLNPAQAKAGQTVQASGWAPLDEVIGELAFGYSLALYPPSGDAAQFSVDQNLDGSFTGSFVVPQSIPGYGTLQAGSYKVGLVAVRGTGSQKSAELASAQLTIGGGLTWAGLNLSLPTWISPAATLSTATMGSSANRMAYCDIGGNMRISDDNGKTWSTTAITGLNNALKSEPYSKYAVDQTGSSQENCISVSLDAAHPDSRFIVAQAWLADAGAPPEFYMGFLSTDQGKTWKGAPVPQGSSPEYFGGFYPDPVGKVEALFSAANPSADQAPAFVVEVTSDGGKTWQAGSAACPVQGACVRWGPRPSSIGGMGSPAPQNVMVSKDGGKTWTFPGPGVELRMSGPNALAGFGPSQTLLVANGADFPLQYSQDAGQTWQVVSIPAIPGVDVSAQPAPGLQILPDGSLLAHPDGKAWQLLTPGSASWCELASSGLPGSVNDLLAIGGNIWWLNANQSGLLTPAKVAISALKCK